MSLISAENRPVLPVEAVIPELQAALARAGTAVLKAPPGSGKTTRVPPALLDSPWLEGQTILMLEPRRLAARAAAERLAEQFGEPVGERAGYRIRFDARVSARTRIEVVTEGILTRRLQGDPELTGVGLVIFDEFHERNLHSDLAMALCLDARQGLRPDLRLLAMSATLDCGPIAELLSAPVIESVGRTFPVAVEYHPPRRGESLAPRIASLVATALEQERGDVLVFLPGVREIRAVHEALTPRLAPATVVRELYGELTLDAQRQAIFPDPEGRRRVVLATSIAETSLTIEGVRIVIDSGLSRQPRFNAASGLTRLETARVSRAEADQRAGRAGRLEPGVCYRLWSRDEQRGLVEFSPPEILQADLAPLALELANWGVRDPADLRWLDPPPPGPMAAARELLQALDAFDAAAQITPKGREMAALGAHPRLAHLLLDGRRRGYGDVACRLAALLSERDVLIDRSDCRIDRRLAVLEQYVRAGAGAARQLGADAAACRRAEQAARQWRIALGLGESASESAAEPPPLGALLTLAWPDRLAQRQGRGAGDYRLANGGRASLDEACPLAGSPCLVAPVVTSGAAGARIRLAEPVSLDRLREWLPDHFVQIDTIEWDRRSEAVSAARQERFGKLVLETRPLPEPAPERVMGAVLEGIRQSGLELLTWRDEVLELRARVAFLRRQFPEAGWPEWSDGGLLAGLEEWLGPWLNGCRSRRDLARLDLGKALLGTLPWAVQQQLEVLAPLTFKVPSGIRRPISYREEGGPVLAVKLQELFGLQETPRIADGRVPLLLHLLSPAGRPIQVTHDLAGFWQRTYGEVKKELKGRYPKHPWPDDPLTAVPTAGVKRRGR